jgi:hypothetical protein
MYGWKVGGGVGDGGKEIRVLEEKKRIRVMIEGLGNAIKGSKGSKDIKATIVLGGGGEVEAAGAISRPRFLVLWRIVGDDKLAGRVDGIRREIKGTRVKTMIGREGGIDGPRTEGVEGEFGLWEKSGQRLGQSYAITF